MYRQQFLISAYVLTAGRNEQTHEQLMKCYEDCPLNMLYQGTSPSSGSLMTVSDPELASFIHTNEPTKGSIRCNWVMTSVRSFPSPFSSVQILVQGGAEKRENVKLTMRFRPAVKFLLHVGS
jgi:hypothetical protein